MKTLSQYHQIIKTLIHIRDKELHTRQWQMQLAFPTQSATILARSAYELFKQRYDWEKPIRSVTIQAIKLVSQDMPIQVNLFTDTKKIEKLEKLDNCVEGIRNRFGKDSIRNAILCQNIRVPSEHAAITMPTGVMSECGICIFKGLRVIENGNSQKAVPNFSTGKWKEVRD